MQRGPCCGWISWGKSWETKAIEMSWVFPWKMGSFPMKNGEFSHEKWWCSIIFLYVYQRVWFKTRNMMNLTEKNGNHESLTHKNDGRMEIWWCIIGIHLDDVIGICGFINKCLNFSGGWISKYYGKTLRFARTRNACPGKPRCWWWWWFWYFLEIL